MRRFAFSVLGALFLFSAFGARPGFAQTKEERAIRALIDANIQASNSVDEKVLQQSFANMSAGPYYPLFKHSVATAADVAPLMKQTLAEVSSRLVTVTGPIQITAEKKLGTANYTWRADITFKDGSKRSFDGRTTAVFSSDGKSWKYVHSHTSMAAPLPLAGSAMEAEQQAVIQTERDAWEAYKSKQIEALKDYYAEGASAFSDDQAYRVRGKADILRGMETSMKTSDILSYQILDPEVKVLGDTALLTYYYTLSTMKDGKSNDSAGKISMVFQKQDGKWRVLHEHIAANESPRRTNRP